MNKREFVNFTLAKKLKKKGFPQTKQVALAMYNEDGILLSLCTKDEEYYLFEDFDDKDYVAATYEQVLSWLRTKGFHLYCYIGSDDSRDADGKIVDEWHFWSYNITDMCGDTIYDIQSVIDTTEYETYEEACEEVIKYCLKKLII